MRLLTPERATRMSLGRRRALQSMGGIALIGLTRKSLASVGAIGRAVGSVGSGSAGPAFAPNYNSSSAGTLMTSPWTTDRQWVAADGGYTASGTLRSGAASSLNGSTDSYSWPWFAGDYTQPPIIDSAANIATAIGQTVTAPPDAYPTVMAIHWPANESVGKAPWITGTPSGNTSQSQKVYIAYYVYAPANFTTNGNSIKWWQLTSDPSGAGSTNDLFMLYTADAGTLKGPCVVLQADVNGLYPATNTITNGSWHCVEQYAQIESPWGSATGIYKCWVDGTPVYSNNSIKYLNAYSITGIATGTSTILSVSGTQSPSWASPDDIAISGVNPSVFNTTGRSHGNAVSSGSASPYTLNWNTSSGYGSYVSGGYATRMGGGGFLASGLKPYYGGGGTSNPIDMYLIVGRFFAAYSDG